MGGGEVDAVVGDLGLAAAGRLRGARMHWDFRSGDISIAEVRNIPRAVPLHTRVASVAAATAALAAAATSSAISGGLGRASGRARLSFARPQLYSLGGRGQARALPEATAAVLAEGAAMDAWREALRGAYSSKGGKSGTSSGSAPFDWQEVHRVWHKRGMPHRYGVLRVCV